MKFKITHVEGSKKGSAESFDVPVLTVGRDPSNVLSFDPVKDDRVSTKHAAFSEQGGSVVVTDLGSRNGTLVNGQKISGPTPVPNGALVQFGENGPMVMVAFEAAAAPAAAPPPAKKSGGGGCVIVLLLAFVALIGVGVLVFFFFVRGGHRGGNPWKSVGIGTSYELLSEMHMEKPVVNDMKTTMKWTLVSRTDEVAHVKMETTTAGNTTSMEQDIELNPKGEGKEQKPVEEKHESVTVPAGTFDCRYMKSENAGATSETWMNDDLPVPVKTVTTTDGTKTTMTLQKIEKK